MSELKIIAEAATNHFGSIYLAKKLVDISMKSGCDYLKFQIINNNETYNSGQYNYGNYNIDDVRHLREISKIKIEDLKKINTYAKKKKISLTATPFGFKALKELVKLKPKIIKIASADIVYKDLIKKAMNTGIKIIISTGMSTNQDVDRLVNFFSQKNFKNFVLMHCVAEYPHSLKRSQLGYIKELKKYGCEIGFSDHTLNNYAALAAVTMGAKWIEKHFTISKHLGGLDAKHSIEAEELSNYCKSLRDLEISLKTKQRSLTLKEKFTRERARRGLYAKKNIKKNQIIRREDLLIVRPENNFDIWNVENFINKKAKKNISSNQEILIKDLGE